MRLLLDTNSIIPIVDRGRNRLPAKMAAVLDDPDSQPWVSVCSMWEARIKERIGKLEIISAVSDWPEAFKAFGLNVVAITWNHVLAEVTPEPNTHDPFDRLLLGICTSEDMKLLTLDRALAVHPLAWQRA